jgi:hypothetical protein
MSGLRELVLDMGFTRDEFMNLLPAALGVVHPHVTGGEIVVEDGRGRVRIVLGTETVRRIASLAVPRLGVTLSFEGYSDPDFEGFMARFRAHYQRGGG